MIIGFGGHNKKAFRVWIDGEDTENKSYCTPSDKTYEPGYLLDPKIKNLKVIDWLKDLLKFIEWLYNNVVKFYVKICDIEIWGLGAEAIYNTQLLLRST